MDLEPPMKLFDKSEYIQTKTGNKVSVKAALCGSSNIVLFGKTVVQPGVMIRGDLAHVKIGKNSIIGSNVVIRPPYRRFKEGIAFYPVNIGEYVVIGADSLISSSSVGNHAWIGQNVVIGKRCVLKECCRIEDGAVLASDTVVPPFAIVAGNPGLVVGTLHDGAKFKQQEVAVSMYHSFLPRSVLTSPGGTEA
jgi:dynactin 5